MTHLSLSRAGIALVVLTTAGFAQNYFYENFNNNNAGWTLGNEWGIGPATASTGHIYAGPDPSSDADGVPGGGVAGVVIGGNAQPVLHPFAYLVSPVMNLSGVPSAYLHFARWLNSDYTPYMQNSIDVFDGTSWINLYLTGSSPGVADSQWVTCITYNVTPYVNPSFQVRFGFMIGSTGVYTVSSWNVDNVSIDATPTAGGLTTQSNSAQASLLVNTTTQPLCGGAGMAVIPNGGTMTFNWQGTPNHPYALFWSPTLNPGGLQIPCIGSADIGTPPAFADAVLVFNGLDPIFPGPLCTLNNNGTATQTLSIPSLTSGQPLGNVQGLVFQPAGCPFILTMAWTLSVQ
jgi:hypothetical protein